MAEAAVTEQPEYGGYDYDYVDKVPERILCTICTKVLRDPHLTGCCGQHFCESCLTQWLKKRTVKSCPHCREENFVHLHNKALKRDIQELKIYCSNRKKGCSWLGETSDLHAHLNSDSGCGYVDVKCPNECSFQPNGLATRVQRKDLKDHLQHKCYLRRYKCEYCNHEDTYYAITTGDDSKYRCGVESVNNALPSFNDSHYSNCPNYPLECPNKCGNHALIKRKYMQAHRQQCPLEAVPCPNKCQTIQNKIFGRAPHQLMRKDLQDHLRNRCNLRRYKCEYCGHEDTYKAITGLSESLLFSVLGKSHYTECPEFPLSCPNMCNPQQCKIKRKDMPSHQTQCPLEPVHCPFEECQSRLVRKDLDTHMTTEVHQHLLLTLQTVSNLKLKIAELEKAVFTLKEKKY